MGIWPSGEMVFGMLECSIRMPGFKTQHCFSLLFPVTVYLEKQP